MLTERDINVIEEIRHGYNTPCFDDMRSCLVWLDELPEDLSNGGREFIMDLIVARHLMFHLPQIGREPNLLPDETLEEWSRIWKEGRDRVPAWPGFGRVELPEDDRLFLESKYRSSLTEELI